VSEITIDANVGFRRVELAPVSRTVTAQVFPPGEGMAGLDNAEDRSAGITELDIAA
jgi:hypothetical protein